MKHLCVILFILTGFKTFGQIRYYPTQPEIFQNHQTHQKLRLPFTGGFTAPQFASADLNGDSKKEMIVFDRVGKNISIYADTAKSGNPLWAYDAYLSSYFPPIQNWFRMADYDRDGDMDVFTDLYSDPILYINESKNGKMKFTRKPDSLYAFLDSIAFSPPYNINILCYSIMLPAIDDIDGDGDYDMLMTENSGAYLALYQNLQVERGLPKDSIYLKYADPCYGSFGLPPGNRYVDFGFTCDKFYGKRAHAGTTISTIDLDNDGDKDLLLGDVFLPEPYYIKNGRKEFNWPVDTAIKQDTLFLPNEGGARSYNFPGTFIDDFDNDGLKDLIVASNDEKDNADQNHIQFFKNTGTNSLPDFKFRSNNFLAEESIDEGKWNHPSFVDLNGDSLLDLVISGGGNYYYNQDTTSVLKLYMNIGSKGNPLYELTDSNWLNFSSYKLPWARVSFGDLNGDKLPDLLIGSLKGKLQYWENTGTLAGAVFTKKTDTFQNIIYTQTITPSIGDIDGDLDNDLILGRSQGGLSYYNNSNGVFSLVTDTFGRIDVSDSIFDVGNNTWISRFDGMATPCIADLDLDGKQDLIIGSKSGRLRLYMNPIDSALGTAIETDSIQYDFVSDTTINKRYQTYISPSVAILDGDTLPDILTGTMRGGFYFWGTQKVAAYQTPVSIIQANEWNVFEVYPNPTHEFITVRFPEIIQQGDIMIYQITGKMILTQTIQSSDIIQLSVKDLPNGIYLLKVQSKDGNYKVRKIVKE